MQIDFCIYKIAPAPAMCLIVTYADDSRLAEIKVAREKESKSKAYWEVTLINPAREVQALKKCKNLRDITEEIFNHILFWFGQCPDKENLYWMLHGAAEEEFSGNEKKMRENGWYF